MKPTPSFCVRIVLLVILQIPVLCLHGIPAYICRFDTYFQSHRVYCKSFSTSGLPDDASKEAASWVEPDNDRTVLIDASTAFRVDENWVYGFPGM